MCRRAGDGAVFRPLPHFTVRSEGPCFTTLFAIYLIINPPRYIGASSAKTTYNEKNKKEGGHGNKL
jgi:hypothetical protein